MIFKPKPSKNPYAIKLKEFPEFVFNEAEAFQFKNNWKKFSPSNSSKTIFEIGCSNSTFLQNIAKKNKQNLYIGCDWKYKIIHKGATKIVRDQVANVKLWRGNVLEFENVFGENELDEVWVLFPDPWAKKSQIKNRLLIPEFFLKMAPILKNKGKIIFKTDHPGYFQWVMSMFGINKSSEIPEYKPNEITEKSFAARQIKVRKTEEELLEPNTEVMNTYTVENAIVNYYRNDKSIELQKQLFSDETTLFEKSFLNQNLPIYFLEIIKK